MTIRSLWMKTAKISVPPLPPAGDDGGDSVFGHCCKLCLSESSIVSSAAMIEYHYCFERMHGTDGSSNSSRSRGVTQRIRFDSLRSVQRRLCIVSRTSFTAAPFRSRASRPYISGAIGITSLTFPISSTVGATLNLTHLPLHLLQ